jgi:hypothetical protein
MEVACSRAEAPGAEPVSREPVRVRGEDREPVGDEAAVRLAVSLLQDNDGLIDSTFRSRDRSTIQFRIGKVI